MYEGFLEIKGENGHLSSLNPSIFNMYTVSDSFLIVLSSCEIRATQFDTLMLGGGRNVFTINESQLVKVKAALITVQLYLTDLGLLCVSPGPAGGGGLPPEHLREPEPHRQPGEPHHGGSRLAQAPGQARGDEQAVAAPHGEVHGDQVG